MEAKNDTRYVSSPQALVKVVQAKTTVAIVPRGGGKTSNIAPDWFTKRVMLMPGAASAIVGSTYKQLLSRTLPPFFGTLREMGWRDGIDFVINQRPPTYWEATPIVKPETYDGVISWSNGHVSYLVSQDRPGSPNSLSVQFDLKDEARFLNKARYDEDSAPTLRGLAQRFGHLPEYLSTLIITDPPTTASARWIYEYEKLHNPKTIEAIVNLYVMMDEHLIAMDNPDNSATQTEHLRRSYNNLKAMYDELRRNAVLFIEGTLHDTVQVLGTEAIEKMKRDMQPSSFNVSVIGLRMKNVIGTFYPDLDDSMHVYEEKYNYGFLNTIASSDWDRADCRQDADLDPSLPLRLGSDHGASYNGFSIGQFNGHVLKYVNNMFVLNPETNMDLVLRFIDYYKTFPCRTIIFYYDHTHIAESGKALNVTFVDEVVGTLRSADWEVSVIYIGHTPSPTDRFKLWSKCLRAEPGHPRILFNRVKTEVLRQSMHDTLAKSGTKENMIVKDKSDERNPKISQELTTHGGDSADILLWGVANPNDTQSMDSSSLIPFVSSR